MALDYQTVVNVVKAKELIQKSPFNPWNWWTFPDRKGDRSVCVGPVTYSPQEILIQPMPHTYDLYYDSAYLPTGVTRTLTKSPNKEYISFKDAKGVDRYYLIPEEGIRLKKKGGTYIVTNPVQDYSISVDRALARKAREDAEELIEYVTLLWNVLIDTPPEHERPNHKPDMEAMPSKDQKEEWFQFLLAAKYPRYDYGWTLGTLQQKIRDKCTKDALAYAVEPVPTTRMDHTQHWKMLDALRAAGRLEQYEGKPKPKRKRKGR